MSVVLLCNMFSSRETLFLIIGKDKQKISGKAVEYCLKSYTIHIWEYRLLQSVLCVISSDSTTPVLKKELVSKQFFAFFVSFCCVFLPEHNHIYTDYFALDAPNIFKICVLQYKCGGHKFFKCFLLHAHLCHFEEQC